MNFMMPENVNQPREYDAVLGGEQGVNIERMFSQVCEEQFTALFEILAYEPDGLNLFKKALINQDKLAKQITRKLRNKINASEIKVILNQLRRKYYKIGFDGIYQSNPYPTDFGNYYYKYIKFYDDGTIIHKCSINNARRVTISLDKDSWNSTDTYTVEDEVVKFLSHSINEVEEFMGTIDVKDNTISFHWSNSTTGYSGYDEYKFFECKETVTIITC